MTMAKNTSITLGDHFNSFITGQIQSGRFNTVSEVVREALRTLEERETKLTLLRRELAIGEQQASDGEFVEDFSYDSLMAELDQDIATT